MAGRQLSVRLAVLFAAVSTVFLLIGGAADAEGPPAPTVEYIVAPGDTLWEIAQQHSEGGDDLRQLVYEIREASGLESATIHPGQVLRVPRH
jgi:nucleoid-associated protein YgaU